MRYCQDHGYRLATVSFVSTGANFTLEEKTIVIEKSTLRKYFEVALVTDQNKDDALDVIVAHFGIPRESIYIVDDRIIRGIRYGNKCGHPTIWFQNGKFANELPNETTGQPTYTIKSLDELLKLL